MHYPKTALAVTISLALMIPALASAQLSPRERARAEELARIQAKANAEEQARVRRMRRDAAVSSCTSRANQIWDYSDNACKRNPLLKRSQ